MPEEKVSERLVSYTSYTIMPVLSSTASVEEESSDSVPLGGNRLRAPFKRPEFMIRGPQERSSLVYV